MLKIISNSNAAFWVVKQKVLLVVTKGSDQKPAVPISIYTLKMQAARSFESKIA
jgi:ABC-type uncharacterized transport system permease subunit